MDENRGGISRRRFLQLAGSAAASLAMPATGRSALRTRNDTRPNILFFFPDQHRSDWLGSNPEIPVPTPNLDALGSRGIRFSNAVCPSPLCAPSRACLASGKEYDRCRVGDNKANYPLDQTTFYDLLGRSGYHVMGCGKFDLSKASQAWGLDGKNEIKRWGFSDGIDNAGKGDAIGAYFKKPKGPKDPYYAYLRSLDPPLDEVCANDIRSRYGAAPRKSGKYALTVPTPIPDEHYCDNWIGLNGLKLLQDSPEKKPWFLQVNFNGPHPPNDITRRMARLYRGPNRVIEDFPQPNDYAGKHTREEHVKIRQNYTAMIENIDRWLGIYMDARGRRGELESTIIVYSSDHGEMLGDHGKWGKVIPYQPSIAVPLIVAGPGIRQGVVDKSPATTLDLTATYLDYADIRIPDDMESRSMRMFLEGRTDTHRRFVYSGLMGWRAVFDGQYKLIEGYDPSRKRSWEKVPLATLLFDLVEDPKENTNIADRASGEVRRLRELLQVDAIYQKNPSNGKGSRL